MNLLTRFKALVQRLLPRHSFARSVGVLAGGTALAQGIGVLALPLITRLYTPEDFSILAIFSSIVAITSVAACLRLEIAIPLPEKDEDAANLLFLALVFCTFISLVIGAAIFLFPKEIVTLVNQPKFEPYLWTIPLGVWLTSSYSAVQLWATRNKYFFSIAKTRMLQTCGSVGLQISIGLLSSIGALGLLLGQLIYCGAGTFGLIRTGWKDSKALFKKINFKRLKSNLKNYKNFPKYSTLEGLANCAATDIPIIIIGSLAAGPEAGFLFLAMKIMVIPLGLIGRAVANVYLAHAAEKNRQGELKAFTISVIDGLCKSGVGPLIFIGLLAPAVASPIFGSEWRRAGEAIAMLTPWFLLNYISSPISMALHVTQNQFKSLTLQISGLVIRVGVTLFAVSYMPSYVLESYALGSALFYAIYFYVIASAVKINFNDVLLIFKKNYTSVVVWIGIAFIIIWIANALIARFTS
ncbi:MAG: oligosaccharide flippase family protein [Burkholderiaceae bacterium]|nr:oligosaccharide flippase family protein [Burkholderiaceae bacterium]